MTHPTGALRRLATGRRIHRFPPHLPAYCAGLVRSFHGDAARAREYVTMIAHADPRRDWWKDVARMLDRLYPSMEER